MKKFWLIFGVILIVVLAVGLFFYFVTAKPNYEKQDIEKPIKQGENLSNIVIEEIHIAYILNELGAYNLHNSPLSSDKPRIEVQVDEEKFAAEIDKGIINVEKGSSEGPDIKIITTREEVINAIISKEIKNYIKNSVNEGKTRLKLVAGYTELFSKGYLSLYQELTGKSFSASVIRIFSQG